MRVAVLVRSLANGGAEKQAVLLAGALARAHDVQLLVVSREPRHPRLQRLLREGGLEADVLPDGRLAKLPALARRLREGRFEALFTFLPSDTVLGALAGRWAGVPRLFGGLRNTGLAGHKVPPLRWVHNHLLEATISNSQRAVDVFAARGFDAARFRVVPNGIALRPEPPPRDDDGPVTVLTVARFVEKKDPHAALRAIRTARDELGEARELRYRLVGYGPLEEDLRRWTRELGLERVVELVVDPPDVEEEFAAADVYLASSRHEGLSNSILEAMNHGLPVVATRAGDTGLLVGEAGRLVEPGDAEGLGRAVAALARDGAERARLGASAHRRVAERFSLERLAAEYDAILGETGATRRRGPSG